MGQERERVGNHVYLTIRNGIYQADYHHDGEHRRKSLKTRNKKEARARAVELDRKLDTEDGLLWIEAERQTKQNGATLDEIIPLYVEFLRTENKRPKTITKYRGVLEQFAAYLAGQSTRRLSAVRMSDIDGYRASRRDELGPGSMTFEGNFMKQFFEWAKRRGYIQSNPLESLTFPKHRRNGLKPIPSRDNVRAILDACKTDRKLHLAFLALTGLRSGELQHLRTEDVDFENGWVWVVSREEHQTKTGESRKVPMHDELRRLLTGHRSKKGGWFFTAEPSNRYPDGDHHINAKKLNDRLTAMLPRLGLPAGRDNGYTVHSLRHFFRTFTTNNGVPERMVNIWMGHAPDRSMGTVYYNPSDEDSQEFMGRLTFGLVD